MLGVSSKVEIVSPDELVMMPLNGWIVISSPMLSFETSHSIGKAPESSAVLKNIGAIFPPRMTPPVFLLGM